MSCIVPRTCTEVQPRDGGPPDASARQGSGTTRRHGVGPGDGEPHDADYPVDRGRDALSRPLADFRTVPAYVLLGDPGSGKSTSFDAERSALGPAACLVTARDFLTFDPGVHPEWRGKTLFIDGLDEVRAGSGDARRPLDAIRARLDALGRPPFRLSCREADWLGANDRTSLGRVSPHDGLPVLRLDPLADQDVERILNDHAGIEDAVAFMAAAKDEGVGGFLENPQCLHMLADVVTNGGGWPESRLALFERACLRMAREHNGEHDAARPTCGGAVSEEELLDAAGRLCAVILFADAAGCAIAPGCEDPDHPHVGRCGREHGEPCRRAIATKLFRAVAEGRFQPPHRHVAEFLAGRHLARLVGGGGPDGRDGRCGVPVRRVLALMTGHDGGVVTALRGLSAWLAAQSGTARRELVERDAIGVVVYGDVSRFSTSEKVALLRALARESRQLEELLKASALGPGQPISAAGSLVAPDTEQALREILTDPRRDDGQQTLVVFLLRALPYGARLPGLTDVLLNLIRDESRIPGVQRRALDALLRQGGRRPGITMALKALLTDVHAGAISDPDDRLLDTLLRRLYPGDLSAAQVWTYLSEASEPSFGPYFSFWRSHLVEKSTEAALAEHLDLLVLRRDEIGAALRSRGLEELPARLLARGLDVHGDGLETKRLYDWLGVGLTWDSGLTRDAGGAAGGRVRDWLTRRPAIQKAILVEGLERCAKSEEGDLGRCARDVERRLRGADPPSDFGRWCLERAAEATDRRIAGYFLDQVIGALDGRSAHDGLTLDEVIERTRNHRLLAGLFAEKSVCELDHDCLEIHRGLSRAEQEREDRHRQWLDHVRAHETALRENRCSPGLLHQLAAAYFDVLSDVVGATPADRLQYLFRDDERLVAAAWAGLRGAIDRDDLPDVDEIVRLYGRNYRHCLALPVLAGMAEMNDAGTGELDRLNGKRIRTALAFHLCTRAVPESPWYRHLVHSRPEVVADVLVQCAAPALRRNRQDVPGLHEIVSREDHAEVARHAVLPLLRAFPLRGAADGRLDGLLWAALRRADADSLLTIIRDKSSRKSTAAAQRVRWLSAGVFAAPEQYIGPLEHCVGGQAERARHVAAFFDAAATASTHRVESDWGTVLVGTSDEAHRRSVASSLGERLGARALGRLIRLAGGTRSPHPGVTELVRGLAVLPDAEAGSVLESLASDPTLSAWEEELVRARDDQLAVRRDAAYRHPDPEVVCRALDGGTPANAGDLAALVADRLDELGDRIRNDNANGWRLFWNEDSRRRVAGPKHEDSCRDALLRELRGWLPDEVDAQPEGRYANDKRADIRISFRDFQVPVEIKKNGHRHLWSALREQLMARYARDPATDGYGIYVVLWFGEVDGCRTLPPPSDVRPRGPDALRQRLQDTLTREEARKISVCVVDLSAPAADGP